ncbi:MULTISPECIES: hypothetical protein [unclassified Nostoc]|uniref:hypothetical protein n=1 Tax=unclassified Nostoc TaxID=2593658 RepID=UPI0015E453FC|nr:hypothetical protein [Nostoc sp. 'Peltigera membranacea cyanobiont' N6]
MAKSSDRLSPQLQPDSSSHQQNCDRVTVTLLYFLCFIGFVTPSAFSLYLRD